MSAEATLFEEVGYEGAHVETAKVVDKVLGVAQSKPSLRGEQKEEKEN